MFTKFILFLILLNTATAVFAKEPVRLSTPDFSQNQFTGCGVGIRPGRKGNYRLEVQTFHNKTLIHNYGHGGSGISLSWGCAEIISELLTETYPNKKPPIAVIGSGVIGLTTAFELLNKGYSVTIYASGFPPDTTSNIGTGIWDPFILSDQNALTCEIGRRAFNRFQAQAQDDFPEAEGVSGIYVYSFGVSEERRSRLLNPLDVDVTFDRDVSYEGVRWETFRIDGDLFLIDLLKKVVQKGGVCIPATFASKNTLLELNEPVIINCLGYGAKKLFNDPLMMPIRGQLLYFAPQKNIDYVLGDVRNKNKHFYFIPWENKLILGGTYEVGEEECSINEQTCQNIWENALRFFNPTL